jgi:vitamin B12 transporter
MTRPLELGGLVLAAWLAAAGAAERGPALQGAEAAFDLGETIVCRQCLPPGDLAATVVEIDSVEIEAMGHRTAADVLHSVPGLYTYSGGSGETVLRLRGYRHHRVKLLVDGVPVNSPYMGIRDLREIPASSIARVRVIKGASSVLYGPNNLGGVIEIITRRPRERPSLTLRGECGSDGYWRSSAFLGLPMGKWYASASLDATDRSGFPLPHDFDAQPLENGHTRENSDYTHASGVFKLGYEGEDSRFGLSLARRGTEFGVPWFLPPGKAKYERVEDLDTWELTAIGERRLSERITGKLALSFLRDDILRKGFDDATFTTQDASGSFTEDARDQVLGATASLHFDHGRWSSLRVAFGAQRSSRKATGFQSQRVGGKKGSVVPVPFDLSERTHLYYLAVEDEIQLLETLTLSAGVRCDTWASRTHEHAFNWNVGLAWQATDALTLTPAVYRRTHFPLLRELYEVGTGNPGLKPETVTGASLDARLALPHQAELRAALYHDRITDLIDRDDDKVFQNLYKARHQGFEIGFTKRFLTHFAFSCDYSYTQAKGASGDIDGQYLRYRPKHKVHSRLTCRAPFGLTASVYHTYLGRQYTSEANDATIRASSVVGLAASQQLDKHTRVFARLDNLLDASYDHAEGLPARGRFCYTGVEVSF